MNLAMSMPVTRREDLLADPDRLLAEWRALVERLHHVHGPEAAAMLGVPEAALLASRVGQGAIALAPELPRLLAGMGGLGKLLVAVRSELGVALAILEGRGPQVGDAGLRVSSGAHELVLGTEGVASCYLFEDDDAHGHTLSLNWFDDAGDVVGRVFLVSKSAWSGARALLEQAALAGQSRSLPPPVGSAIPDVIRMPSRAAEGECLVEGERAGPMMTRAVLALARLPSVRLDLEGRGAALAYEGQLPKTSHTPPAAHATSEGLKLHSRPAKALSAWRCEGPEGRAGLRFVDRDGGSLTLLPGGEAAAAARWTGAVISGEEP